MNQKVKNIDLIDDLTSEKFINYYKKEVLPDLVQIEKKRIWFVWLAWLLLIFYGWGCIYFVMFTLQCKDLYNHSAGDTALYMFGLLFCFSAVIFSLEQLVYILFLRLLRLNVFDKLFAYWGDFMYYPLSLTFPEVVKDSTMTKEIYDTVANMQMFNFFEKFYCSDYFSGVFNDLDVQIMNVGFAYCDLRTAGSLKPGFSGIVATVKCNKKFSATTVVVPVVETYKPYAGMQKVELEDPLFSKLYNVYSTDQVEARYLLTTSFMERMRRISIRNKNLKLRCSFENKKFNFALASYVKYWFRVNMLKPVDNIQFYQGIMIRLAMIMSVVGLLKLDDDIGM